MIVQRNGWSVWCLLVALGGMASGGELANIVLIVADDVGYSDLGCYGGEIDTPHLDRLAKEGVRFSEFHVNPMCVVTRTSLLTGHEHSQSDSYRRSMPIAHLMSTAGYSTSISGKWHQPDNPLDAGFDTFYGFLGGAINSWTGTERGRPAIQTNRDQPTSVASDWYSSDAFTDHAMRQMDASTKAGRPFFSFLAFNAPHTPLHAPREHVEKYLQRYNVGWERLRKQRFEKLKQLGVIDDRYVMSPPEAEVRRWDELPPDIRSLEARRMAAYAGMLDRLDWNIGRLLAYLDENGLADNTLVVFLGDNGGAYSNGNIRTDGQQVPWEPTSNPFVSNGWSYLKNTPFRWYKSCAHEGGVSVPMIVRWPEKLSQQAGTIRSQRTHVTDLYPTFLELAGVRYPQSDGDRRLKPLYGQSMVSLWHDPSLSPLAIHDEIFWGFNQTGKGLVQGDWKISSISDGPWRLYNITADPAEARNVADEQPAKLEEMNDAWFRFAKQQTGMPASWRAPLKAFQEGWGFHRLRMVLPGYVRVQPPMSAMDVPTNTKLTFFFNEPIGIASSDDRTIRLYDAADVHHPVWESDPSSMRDAVGKQQIKFADLPVLKPNTTYFALADAGWICVGGKLAGPINDGAYWYRFRTGPK